MRLTASSSIVEALTLMGVKNKSPSKKAAAKIDFLENNICAAELY
jgi:hypothetical protein